MHLMSRAADAENTDSMLRNSLKFIVPGLPENTTHIRPANGFSCQYTSQTQLYAEQYQLNCTGTTRKSTQTIVTQKLQLRHGPWTQAVTRFLLSLPPPKRLCFHRCLFICLFVCYIVYIPAHHESKRCQNYDSAYTKSSKKYDDTYIRIDVIPQLDGQTDRQTDGRMNGQMYHHQYRTRLASAC